MSDTLLAAIVGAVAGIITGSIGSLFAPWATWGVEKRKQKLTYRRELIAKWRAMIQDIITRHNEDQELLIKKLQVHADWYSLKPHLEKRTLGIIGAEDSSLAENALWVQRFDARHPEMEPKGGRWSVKILNDLIDEVGKIEKKWGLV